MKNFNYLLLLFITKIIAFPSQNDFSKAFINVAEKTNPAVVSIISEKTIENDYHFFFRQMPQQEFKGQALGSGVIIDANEGYIVTNNHVINDAEEIKILLEDKREIIAEVIGTDPPSDLAILKIDPTNLTEVKIGNSDKLRVGEWIVAIGSPFGLHLNHTVTAGIVSAVGRSDIISRRNFENFIQHDAAINPGNSGGALMNLKGELVGINTAIATEGFSKQSAGVGFAIPINQVMRVAEDLISSGSVTRGWLGVSIQDIDEQIAKAMNLDIRSGALVSQILEDSPASKSSLKQQDIIIEIDGQKISSSSNLRNIIASSRPNESKKIKVLRDGKEKNVTVKLGERPNEQNLSLGIYENDTYDILGLKVENIDMKNVKNKIEGVRIYAVENNRNQSDLMVDDIIVKIGQSKINSVDQYAKELKKYGSGDSILLYINRNESSRFVGMEIK
tara:strand:+ start:37 stop:1377 length:1341 start_codon:yes stop_codon:yes gene_type:complete